MMGTRTYVGSGLFAPHEVCYLLALNTGGGGAVRKLLLLLSTKDSRRTKRNLSSELSSYTETWLHGLHKVRSIFLCSWAARCPKSQ